MNGPEWLHAQLTSFTCPACRRRYREGRVKLLAERDGLYFVDLDCSRCGSHTVAIVTVDLEDAEAVVDELTIDVIEPLPAGAAPVTADDVIEMHQFLDRFEGDVRALFRAAGRPPTPDAGGG